MTDHARPTIEVQGSVRADGDDRGTVRMESAYATDTDDLWSALTEPDRLARWIATVDDLRLGGTFSATFTSGWEGPGRVETCDPPRRLVVTLDPGTADETTIETVLSPLADGTRLVVKERGIPMREIALHGAGWQTHVEDLGSHLRGDEPSEWSIRWKGAHLGVRGHGPGTPTGRTECEHLDVRVTTPTRRRVHDRRSRPSVGRRASGPSTRSRGSGGASWCAVTRTPAGPTRASGGASSRKDPGSGSASL
jgi:uncharacterized protein YndB with AHSA1/START domain